MLYQHIGSRDFCRYPTRDFFADWRGQGHTQPALAASPIKPRPFYDRTEREDDYLIEIPAIGVTKEEIEIEATASGEGSWISIRFDLVAKRELSGEKISPVRASTVSNHKIYLPNVDPKATVATLELGLLTLVVPKAKPQLTTITVK